MGLIFTVATMPSHPESFPVNALVPIKGTPLGDSEPVAFDAIVRTIATARLVLPKTIIRLAAGRNTMSRRREADDVLYGRSQCGFHRREDVDDRVQRLG